MFSYGTLTLSYGMWLLVPWPGIEPGPPSIESTALTCGPQGSPLLGSFCFKFHPAGFPGTDHDSWRHLKGKESQWTNTISSGGIENTFAWLNPWRQASGKHCHCHGDAFKGNDQKKKKGMTKKQLQSCAWRSNLWTSTLIHCSKGRD